MKTTILALLAAATMVAPAAASAALVTWTVELDSRTVYSLGLNGRQNTLQTDFMPTLITFTTVIGAVPTTAIATSDEPRGTFTSLRQDFELLSGLQGSGLLSGLAGYQVTTANENTTRLAIGSGSFFDTPGSTDFSYTEFGLQASRLAVECIPSCVSNGDLDYKEFVEYFQLSFTNPALFTSTDDVRALTLGEYLALLTLQNTNKFFEARVLESGYQTRCVTETNCLNTDTAYSGESYTGRVLTAVVTQVPEPGTLALLGVALASLALTRRRA